MQYERNPVPLTTLRVDEVQHHNFKTPPASSPLPSPFHRWLKPERHSEALGADRYVTPFLLAK